MCIRDRYGYESEISGGCIWDDEERSEPEETTSEDSLELPDSNEDAADEVISDGF